MTGDRDVVSERWQAAGDGAFYATSRWRSPRARERDVKLLRRLLARTTGGIDSVLDVPCGTGRLRDGTVGALGTARWCGADVSAAMLGAAEAPRSELVRASAHALPFADASFDVVVCCRLLHHFADTSARADVVGELTRVARRYVVASYWDEASYGAWRRRTTGPLRRRRPAGGRRAVRFADLRAQLDACGYDVVGRAFSLRWVSQQSFILAERRASATTGRAAHSRSRRP